MHLLRRGKLTSSLMHSSSHTAQAGVLYVPSYRPSADWQSGGYRGEPTDLEDREGLTKDNDKGYEPGRASNTAVNPFDRNDVDPAIANVRSASLMEHTGAGGFWERARHYPKILRRLVSGKNNPLTKMVHAWNSMSLLGRRAVRIGALILMILMIMYTCARWMIFNITDVTVLFTNPELQESMMSGEEQQKLRDRKVEIIERSGIRRGDNLLSLNEDRIRDRIEQDWFLIYQGMETRDTHRILLRVRKRSYEAYLCVRGINYLVDRYGMVLDENGDLDTRPFYVEAVGLQVSGVQKGKILTFVNPEQYEVFSKILLEIQVLGIQQDVARVYFQDLNNLSLVTRDNYSVKLGTRDQIHAKLRSMVLVLEELRKEGKPSGTIDVTTPKSPCYIQENPV